MKKVYGYIRVSTVKQGTGVSLQEQKDAIIRYAEKHDLTIIQWFEEQETAAKQGRPLFTKMMKLLQIGKADGVVIHKIDRSARNLRDWAALGDLIDKGVDVHFAHESLDLDTRGGRLAADIQAVIASDYIRNLRDETIKGLYGRLKQGIYPLGAPIGYRDTGRGNLKAIDEIQGPLVRKAFELYATEKYNLRDLTERMAELGLRNSKGQLLSVATMSKVLNNPFYAGVLKVKGQTFQGGHEPLVSGALFHRVEDILHEKTNTKFIKHDFLFRRLVQCSKCRYSLIGERQKGYVYYRCHTRVCPTKGIREESIEKALLAWFKKIQLHTIENQVLDEMLDEVRKNWSTTQNSLAESLRMQEGQLLQKLDRLTDAYIDTAIDKTLFEKRKEKLLIELQGVRHRASLVSTEKQMLFKKVKEFLELLKSLINGYKNGIPEEKREILKTVTSNVTITGKKPMITIRSPFYELANRGYSSSSDPARSTPRNCTPEVAGSDNISSEPVDTPELRASIQELLDRIFKFFEEHPDEDEGE